MDAFTVTGFSSEAADDEGLDPATYFSEAAASPITIRGCYDDGRARLGSVAGPAVQQEDGSVTVPMGLTPLGQHLLGTEAAVVTLRYSFPPPGGSDEH